MARPMPARRARRSTKPTRAATTSGATSCAGTKPAAMPPRSASPGTSSCWPVSLGHRRSRAFGQHHGRQPVQQPRRPGLRQLRPAVDPDRRQLQQRRRLRQHGQQPDAGGRRHHQGDPPLPGRPLGLRDHRRDLDARPQDDVHQRPAPGRVGQATRARPRPRAAPPSPTTTSRAMRRRSRSGRRPAPGPARPRWWCAAAMAG
jgi:hypothetical protein